MKRKPFLYVINFLMPVFQFLVLDLASFFIDSSGGEKLSFKVTLLLAISVLLLLLKDMLPSTANDVPLIDAGMKSSQTTASEVETLVKSLLRNARDQDGGSSRRNRKLEIRQRSIRVIL